MVHHNPVTFNLFSTVARSIHWRVGRVCFESESQKRTAHQNTSISKHLSFQGSNWRKLYSACVNKEKLMTDIDTDKLALISDCPFLMSVFYVPSNEMISQ